MQMLHRPPTYIPNPLRHVVHHAPACAAGPAPRSRAPEPMLRPQERRSRQMTWANRPPAALTVHLPGSLHAGYIVHFRVQGTG